MTAYKDYHTNPINKIIHVACVPLIMSCVLNFFSCFKLQVQKKNIKNLGSKIIHGYDEYKYDTLLALLFSFYYLKYHLIEWVSMSIFIYFIYKLSQIWRNNDTKWLSRSVILFSAAWLLQFFGHYIEGNRPAFFTSLQMSIFEAPLHTLKYIYPFSELDV